VFRPRQGKRFCQAQIEHEVRGDSEAVPPSDLSRAGVAEAVIGCLGSRPEIGGLTAFRGFWLDRRDLRAPAWNVPNCRPEQAITWGAYGPSGIPAGNAAQLPAAVQSLDCRMETVQEGPALAQGHLPQGVGVDDVGQVEIRNPVVQIRGQGIQDKRGTC
jgi:hypothetical protein